MRVKTCKDCGVQFSAHGNRLRCDACTEACYVAYRKKHRKRQYGYQIKSRRKRNARRKLVRILHNRIAQLRKEATHGGGE